MLRRSLRVRLYLGVNNLILVLFMFPVYGAGCMYVFLHMMMAIIFWALSEPKFRFTVLSLFDISPLRSSLPQGWTTNEYHFWLSALYSIAR